MDKINPQTSPRSVAEPAVVCIVVPTFNERDNVGQLIESLTATLSGVAWEVIVVDDDSPDQTWAVVNSIARQDGRVRCLRRIGRRGLSGACIEGILATGAPYAAVLDADMQHDAAQLPKMLAMLQDGRVDLVVGSRYIPDGSADAFDGSRSRISRLATNLAQRALGVAIADPMSGFFMIRTDRFAEFASSLSVHGFKILLDIIATAHGQLRIVEIPYRFGPRRHGQSKLSSIVVLDFLGLIIAKLTNDAVSLRFLMFAIVGSSGLAVHFAVLYVSIRGIGLQFLASQTTAAVTAMTTNFLLNNALTYRDQRLAGGALIKGLFAFYLVCSIGLLANLQVAFSIYSQRPLWWLAGAAGAITGAVWNYTLSSFLVWRRR